MEQSCLLIIAKVLRYLELVDLYKEHYFPKLLAAQASADPSSIVLSCITTNGTTLEQIMLSCPQLSQEELQQALGDVINYIPHSL